MAQEGENSQDNNVPPDNSFDFLGSMDLANLGDVNEIMSSQSNTNDVNTEDIVEDTTNDDGDTTGDSEDNQEDPSSKDIKKPSPFTPYAKLVKEEGVLPNFDVDAWDGEPAGLIQAMQAEIQNGIKTSIDAFDPRVKWLQENVQQGVSFEDLLNVDRQRISLNSITEEALVADEALQKNILTEYYKETTQFSDARIAKEIERLETIGDLTEESKGVFEELKQINVAKEQQLRVQAQQRQAQQAEQSKLQLEQFKQTVAKIDEIVPGVKVNTAIKDKLYKGLTTAVDINPATGQPVNEIQKAFMENPQLETTFAYLWYATDGFKDFKVFGSAGKKSAVKEFESAISNMDFSQGTKQKVARPTSDQSLVDQMEQISRWGRQQ